MTALTVKLKYLRHSARKLRYVLSRFTGMELEKAIQISSVMPQDSARYLHKALKMAEDVAKQKELNSDEMIVSQLITNVGPKIKRTRPTARGRASRYQKHLSHLVVSIDQPRKKIMETNTKIEKKNGPKN